MVRDPFDGLTAFLLVAEHRGGYAGWVVDRYASNGLLAGLDLHYMPQPGMDLALGIRQSAVSYTQGERGSQLSAARFHTGTLTTKTKPESLRATHRTTIGFNIFHPSTRNIRRARRRLSSSPTSRTFIRGYTSIVLNTFWMMLAPGTLLERSLKASLSSVGVVNRMACQSDLRHREFLQKVC